MWKNGWKEAAEKCRRRVRKEKASKPRGQAGSAEADRGEVARGVKSVATEREAQPAPLLAWV